MKYILKLKHHFCAAHQLTHAYSKECNENIHGHNWKVLVKIKSNKLKDEMIVDFKKIKELIDVLDHKNLNEILAFEPTAENIAAFLHRAISTEMRTRFSTSEKFKVSIELWETPDASITCTE